MIHFGMPHDYGGPRYYKIVKYEELSAGLLAKYCHYNRLIQLPGLHKMYYWR